MFENKLTFLPSPSPVTKGYVSETFNDFRRNTQKNRVSQWRQLHFSSDHCAWNLSPLMPVFTRTLPVWWIRVVVSTTVEVSCVLNTV